MMTLNSAFETAGQGLTAASERLQIHANNIANVNTPKFVRKIPVLVENNNMSFDEVLNQIHNGVLKASISAGPGGVTMAGTVIDPTPQKRMYMPGHPEADKDGYVTMSNVNILSDIADATVSARVYEANLAVVSLVKNMANRALEIGRGQ